MALFLKIIRRTFLIFIIGTFIYGTATFLGTLREASLQPDFVGSPWKAAFASLAHVRILGVLQRLALCYGIGSLLVTTVRHRYIPYLVAVILLYIMESCWSAMDLYTARRIFFLMWISLYWGYHTCIMTGE